MGGKKYDGKRVTREEAEVLYREVMIAIGQLDANDSCPIPTDARLAGSYRRGKADSGDMDIVLIPVDLEAFDSWCLEHFGSHKNGNVARTGLFKGVQVEFYVATDENWGSQLLMWTGSAHHNIKLRRRAKTMGYSLSQYGFRDLSGVMHPMPNESALFAFLHLDFIAPEDR
jgi:DNA polymerase (family 10)